jgi:hypothetical protein
LEQASEDRHRLTLGATRELILPATLIGCFALYYFAELPFWAVLTCAAPMMVVYALAPLWAARSMAAFDRATVSLLAKRDPSRLRARYSRALGMRLFGAPGLVAERKAMMLLECGSPRAALAAYRDALDELGKAAPDRVVLGAAHASFAAGDDAGAVVLYRRVLGSVGALPGVERKLAHALIRRGEDLEEALSLLERTGSQLSDAEAKQEQLLMRALANAKLGRTDTARELLQRASSESERARELHEAILEQIERGVTPRA